MTMPHDSDAPAPSNPIATGVGYFIVAVIVLVLGGFLVRFAWWALENSWGWLF